MSTLLIDLEGHELKQEEVELLEHPLVAGLILFTRNFYDRQQVQALIKSIRQRVKKPLLITVDQEGGRVQRFREGFTQLPAMQAFAALVEDSAQQQQIAKEAGWQMAAEMVALDIDLSFAPVLDLGHECRAIGDRSFGCDVKSAVKLVIPCRSAVGSTYSGSWQELINTKTPKRKYCIFFFIIVFILDLLPFCILSYRTVIVQLRLWHRETVHLSREVTIFVITLYINVIERTVCILFYLKSMKTDTGECRCR